MANAIIAEIDGVPPPGAMPHYPIAEAMKLPDLFALSQTGEAGRVEVGSYALSASTTETESAYVERMNLAIGIDRWPDQDIGLVAVDVADGKPRILKRIAA